MVLKIVIKDIPGKEWTGIIDLCSIAYEQFSTTKNCSISMILECSGKHSHGFKEKKKKLSYLSLKPDLYILKLKYF